MKSMAKVLVTVGIGLSLGVIGNISSASADPYTQYDCENWIASTWGDSDEALSVSAMTDEEIKVNCGIDVTRIVGGEWQLYCDEGYKDWNALLADGSGVGLIGSEYQEVPLTSADIDECSIEETLDDVIEVDAQPEADEPSEVLPSDADDELIDEPIIEVQPLTLLANIAV